MEKKKKLWEKSKKQIKKQHFGIGVFERARYDDFSIFVCDQINSSGSCKPQKFKVSIRRRTHILFVPCLKCFKVPKKKLFSFSLSILTAFRNQMFTRVCSSNACEAEQRKSENSFNEVRRGEGFFSLLLSSS